MKKIFTIVAILLFSAVCVSAAEYTIEEVQCLAASDCAEQTCKTAACTNNSCVYTAISGCGETPVTTTTGGGGGGGGSYVYPSVMPTPTPGSSVSPSLLGPVISNISETVKSTSIAITWKTDKPSISWIVYGPTVNYDKEVKITGTRTSHTLTIGNLKSNATYHYLVLSKDESGKINLATDRKFTTKAGSQSISTPTQSSTPSPITTPNVAVKKSNPILDFFSAIGRFFVKLLF